MESKKINQLATELTPALSDLTIIGDPTTGISKKITLSQMASLFTGTVEEYPDVASFPLVGVADTIYIALDTNVLYRWDTTLTSYVELSPNIINSLVFNDANGFDGTISLVGSVATLTITTALTTGSVGFIGASGALLQDNANFFWDDSNNRLGIGTNAPTTAIDAFGSGIIGRLNGTSTNNSFLGFASAGTNKWSIGNVQSDHRFRIYSEANAAELVSVLQTGEFGIGIANPTTKLHIDGGASALIANLDANVSVAKSISFRSDNSNRINLEVSGTESGSNVGADLFIRTYTDAGALLATPLTITRSTGNAIFNNNIGLGLTPSAWGSIFRVLEGGDSNNQSAIAFQNSANVLYLTTNSYFDTSWKYKFTDVAGQYLIDGNEHRFYTAASGTAGNAITWGTPALAIGSTGATFSNLLSTTKTADGIIQKIGGNTTKANIYQFTSGGLAGAVFNIGHNFYYDGTNYGQDNTAKSGWVTSSNLNSDTFSIARAAAGSTSAPTNILSLASTGVATFSSNLNVNGERLYIGGSTNNAVINNIASIRFNIDCDNNNAAGETFDIGHNQEGIDNNNVLFRVKDNGNVLIGTTTDNGFNFVGATDGKHSYLGNTMQISAGDYGGTERQGAFGVTEWGNQTSAVINLASVFPRITFSSRALSVLVQIGASNTSTSHCSALVLFSRTSNGGWSSSVISNINNGGTVINSVSGSGTSITINFNVATFGSAMITILNRA